MACNKQFEKLFTILENSNYDIDSPFKKVIKEAIEKAGCFEQPKEMVVEKEVKGTQKGLGKKGGAGGKKRKVSSYNVFVGHQIKIEGKTMAQAVPLWKQLGEKEKLVWKEKADVVNQEENEKEKEKVYPKKKVIFKRPPQIESMSTLNPNTGPIDFITTRKMSIDMNALSNNIAKYARWCLIELACNPQIGHNYSPIKGVVSRLRSRTHECGSIDQAIQDVTGELFEKSKFASRWNQIHQLPREIRDDEEEYSSQLGKLFLLVTKWYGLYEVDSLHSDYYNDLKDKFFELIDFDHLIQYEMPIAF